MTNQLQQHHIHHRRPVDLRIPAIEKYAYCLCLHVKPTTIFIAVFKLIRALLFASILLNSEFTVVEDQATVGGISLALEERHRSTAAAVNILTRIIMASVSAVGIYAVISGRAALLMPLYAILLVDFFFALPAFYNRELDPSLADSFAEFRNYSTASNQYTRYSLMLFSTITMIVKIYFLCVIWKCYRYLRLIELVSPIRLTEIYPHVHQGNPQYPVIRVLGSTDTTDMSTGINMAPPPYESIASSMKPPNYEEAMKSSGINYSTNPTISQTAQLQQTVVVTNPNITEQQQNSVSTQVIAEQNSLGSEYANTANNVTLSSGSVLDDQNCNQNLVPNTAKADNSTTDSRVVTATKLVTSTNVDLAKTESRDASDTN